MHLQSYADGVVQTIREPLLVLDADLRVKSANRSFYQTFKTTKEQTAGRLIYELGSGQWDIPALRKILEEILPNDGEFEEFAVEREFPDVGHKMLVLNARRLHDDDNRTQLILLAIEDVTKRRQAEAEAVQQRIWLRVTLSSIGDAVIATDVDARITFMNPTAEKLTGWMQEQAAGRPLSEVFNIVNEETRRLVESPVSKAIRQGQIVGLANHTVLICRDQSERYIDDSAAPIRDERGAIIGVVLVFRDIGERRAVEKRIELSESRYRRLFEAAHDGILILDAKNERVIDVNRFLLDLLHQPRDFFLGKEIWELGVFQDIDASKEAMRQLRQQGFVRYEDLPLQDRDGRQIPVEFVSNVYREDGGMVIQCNIRDVRQRKDLESQRAALLAQEHAARVEAQAAERANRAKDIFLATLSHEMRTPLNAILGWATILGGENVAPAEVKEGAAVIMRNARAQAQLIEDVLDVSRIVSDKLRLEMKPCNLDEVIAAAVDTVRHDVEKKLIQLTVDIRLVPSEVFCDPVRIQQVVWNLLSNSVKFTPPGGTIHVVLTREGSNAVIQVTDSGRGIAPEFVPHVFDRFRQESDTGSRRKFGGLGLGLSIVKHLVEQHGGAVRAQSKGEGLGAVFTVYLPIRPVGVKPSPDGSIGRSSAAGPLDQSSASVKGLRIVVVDDEEDSRRLLAKILTDAGAIVSAASSAAQAIEAVNTQHPQILISDLGMPDTDGFDLIRQIRANGHGPEKLPAVALSAFAHKDDETQALSAGFQVHVSKPVDPRDLMAVLASLTSSSS